MAGKPYLVALLCLPLACGGGGSTDVPDAGDGDAALPLDSREVDATAGPCDPVAQTGCTSTEKCSIIPSSGSGPARVGCVDRVGSLQELDACTPATSAQPDDCAPGLACRGSADPRCLAFCASSPADTCATGETCLFAEDLDGDLYDDVEYCARTCDVLDQDCPAAGIGCYPTRDGPICAPIGAGDTPAGEGEYCAYANSCDVGLGCFYVSASWYCLRLCDYFQTGGPTCDLGQVCNRHDVDDWGVCVSGF